MARTNGPFFIVGSERSGTTLLMAMLGAHSRLAVPEVAWYYPRFRAFLHTYGDLNRAENFRTLVSEMIFGLKTPFFGLDLNPSTIVDKLLKDVRENTFAEAYRVILQVYADAVGKPRWGEKTPHNLYYVDEILGDFPDARFIHLTRDGRDVAADQLASAFGPRNAYAAALVWRRAREEAEDLGARLTKEQWLDVRYEALVADPARVLAAVTDFLGELYEPSLLDFHQGETAQRRAKTRDHRPLGRPVTADYVGIYRTSLSLRDQGIFGFAAGDSLRRAAYGDSVPPVEVSPEEGRLFLELDARIRAATLDAPGGHIVYESYNDWLADRREERRGRGLWSRAPEPRLKVGLGWDEEFFSGQRAPLKWKRRFALQRRYSSEELVL